MTNLAIAQDGLRPWRGRIFPRRRWPPGGTAHLALTEDPGRGRPVLASKVLADGTLQFELTSSVVSVAGRWSLPPVRRRLDLQLPVPAGVTVAQEQILMSNDAGDSTIGFSLSGKFVPGHRAGRVG